MQEGALMNQCERRRVQRYIMRIPLAFRPLADVSNPQRYAEIVDISPFGICFSTHSHLPVGSGLQMFLKLPKEVIGKPSPEWRWWGTVVRVTRDTEDSFDMGVRFAAYDEINEPLDSVVRHAKEQQSTQQVISEAEAPRLSTYTSDRISALAATDRPTAARKWKKWIIVP
jgi:PilZ domain